MSKNHKHQNNNYNEVKNENVETEVTTDTTSNDVADDTVIETEETSKTQDDEEIVVDNSTDEDNDEHNEVTNFDSIDITPSDDIYDENGDISEKAIDNFIDALEKEHECDETSNDNDSEHKITDNEVEQMFDNEEEMRKAQEQEMAERQRLKEEHDKQIQQEIMQEQERIAASTPNVPAKTVNPFVTKKFTIRFGYNSNNVRATSEKTVDLVELFDLFVKYRSALYGLTSTDSYKEISEFMKTEKFVYNNSEIEENGKKQFLQKLYTNTVLVVKMLNK